MVLLDFLDFPLECLIDGTSGTIHPLPQLASAQVNVELCGLNTGMTSQQSDLIDLQLAPGEVC
jgi:hypothetical protein